MELRFDHLVVAAASLEEGVAWVESRLGVPMGPGGKHAVMGTHNRLLGLGPGRFLEVIAIDPAAPSPVRPRWFALDDPAMGARLRAGPALIHWVVRTDDIERALALLPGPRPEVLALERGEFRWKIGVPVDGALPMQGLAPTVIEWSTRHPTEVIPDSGWRMEALSLEGARAPALLESLRRAGMAASEPVQAGAGAEGMRARICRGSESWMLPLLL